MKVWVSTFADILNIKTLDSIRVQFWFQGVKDFFLENKC